MPVEETVVNYVYLKSIHHSTLFHSIIHWTTTKGLRQHVILYSLMLSDDYLNAIQLCNWTKVSYPDYIWKCNQLLRVKCLYNCWYVRAFVLKIKHFSSEMEWNDIFHSSINWLHSKMGCIHSLDWTTGLTCVWLLYTHFVIDSHWLESTQGAYTKPLNGE